MTSRDAPLRFLSTLWSSLGSMLFAGEIRLATDNATYRLRDGTFIRRAKHPGGTDLASFVLTSPTTSLKQDEPEPRPQPEPEPWIARRVDSVKRPPSFRVPLPPSMTRLRHAAPAPSER